MVLPFVNGSRKRLNGVRPHMGDGTFLILQKTVRISQNELARFFAHAEPVLASGEFRSSGSPAPIIPQNRTGR